MHYTKEIINQFVTESREYLESIEDDLLNLEKTRSNPDPALVYKVFRVHHTIKEGAGFLELKNITDLALVMENIFSMMRAGEIKPEPEIIDALLEGAGCLNILLDDIEHSNEMDISGVYNQLLNLLSGNVSQQVKRELDTNVALSGLQGENIGFEINEFTWKNLPAEGKFLYVLKYDLMELARSENRRPLQLIRQLLGSGDIIEGRLETQAEDLRTGSSREPLLYEVLYSTTLVKKQLEEAARLPGSRIIPVKIPTQEASNYQSFNTFKDYILPRIGELKRKTPGPFRVWSAGLPTGQEPYAICVLLDEYIKTCGLPGISANDFSILATDHSPKILAKTIIGQYSHIEIFRSAFPEKTSRYFKSSGSSWTIHDSIRSRVEFRYIDLTIPFTFPATFDVIFCHNALTPLDIKTQQKVINRFHSLLSENGFLLPGTNTGESLKGLTAAGKFESIKCNETIIYKKKDK